MPPSCCHAHRSASFMHARLQTGYDSASFSPRVFRIWVSLSSSHHCMLYAPLQAFFKLSVSTLPCSVRIDDVIFSGIIGRRLQDVSGLLRHVKSRICKLWILVEMRLRGDFVLQKSFITDITGNHHTSLMRLDFLSV